MPIVIVKHSEDSPFITVRLETKEGELVSTLRHTMAPFPRGSRPEMVCWGQRFFTLHAEPEDPTEPVVYREGMLVGVYGDPEELAAPGT